MSTLICSSLQIATWDKKAALGRISEHFRVNPLWRPGGAPDHKNYCRNGNFRQFLDFCFWSGEKIRKRKKLEHFEILPTKFFWDQNFRNFSLWKLKKNWSKKYEKINFSFLFFRPKFFNFHMIFNENFRKCWSPKKLVGKISKCSNFKDFANYFFGSKVFVQELFEVCWHKISRSESR